MRKSTKYLQQKLTNIRKKGTFKWVNQQFVSELGEENNHGNDLVDDKDEKCDDDDADDADADDDADDNNDDDSATDNLGAAFYQDQRKSDWFSGYHRYEKVEDIDERLKTGKALCGSDLEIVQHCTKPH